MNSCITVGVTGGIGSGKTTVCRVLHAMGYPVFYSDKVAGEILDNDSGVRSKVIALLGDQAYTGELLNKAFVSAQIFSEPEIRERMNAIVHPAVRGSFETWLSQQETDIAFNEAAILFETGSYKNFDKNILVCSPNELRIKRLKERDNLSLPEIANRMAGQWSDDKKKDLADFVVENDERQLLIPQILEIIRLIRSK